MQRCSKCGHKGGTIAMLVSLDHQTVLQDKTIKQQERQIVVL